MKFACVTGYETEGLSRDLALAISKEGFHIILHSEDLAATMPSRLKQSKKNFIMFSDLSDEHLAEFFFNKIQKKNDLHGLVNCITIFKSWNMPIQDWKAMVDHNLYSSINASKQAIPLLRKTRGFLINIAPLFPEGLVGTKEALVYSTARESLMAFTSSLSAVEPRIKINAIFPVIKEPIDPKAIGLDFKEIIKEVLAMLAFSSTATGKNKESAVNIV